MKHTTLLATLALSLALLTGCATSSQQEPSTPINPEIATPEVTTPETITPTTGEDRMGRSYILPTSTEKIMSLAPSNTEILIGLGLGDSLAVVDSYSSLLEGVPETAMVVDLQVPDMEALLLAECDLVVSSEINLAGGDDPYTPLSDAGVSVVYLPSATSFDDIYADILFLGEVTQTSEKAQEMVQEMQTRLETVTQTVAELEPKTLYFEISPAPYLFTVGEGTFLAEAITMAGGVNLFADQFGWISPSEEDVLTRNPQIIITNATYMEDPVGEILSRSTWSAMDAISGGEVYLVDGDLTSRSSQHIVLAVEEMAKILHPEAFA
ncbi:MAG: ABC transporter substrate-binding protein [Eubacteriales bacterium]